MSNSRISGLTSATTPLAGTEVLPIVQSGTTEQVSVANLTAGRAVSAASLSLSTGGVTQGTAATGYNFSANTPASGMTSQLLNWYEEGTFQPTVVGTSTAGTVTYNSRYGRYTKIGRVVYIEIYLYWVSGTGSGYLTFGNLPFTSANSNTYPSLSVGSFYALTFNSGTFLSAYVNNNSTTIILENCPTGGTTVTPGQVTYNASGAIQISGFYSV
jgi:hypothetical protein